MGSADVANDVKKVGFIATLTSEIRGGVTGKSPLRDGKSRSSHEKTMGLSEFRPGANLAVGGVGRRAGADDNQRPRQVGSIAGGAVKKIVVPGRRLDNGPNGLGNPGIDIL